MSTCLEISVSLQKSIKDEENYVLTLAPMTRTPKINFGHTKVDCQVERDLLIINPQQFEVKLKAFPKDFPNDVVDLVIEKGSNLNLKIKWRPRNEESFKSTIIFKVVNNERLKFNVCCYGESTATSFKKITLRKPLGTIQTSNVKSNFVAKKPIVKENNINKHNEPCQKFEYESIYNKCRSTKEQIQQSTGFVIYNQP